MSHLGIENSCHNLLQENFSVSLYIYPKENILTCIIIFEGISSGMSFSKYPIRNINGHFGTPRGNRRCPDRVLG